MDMSSFLSVELALDPVVKQSILPGRNNFVDGRFVVGPTPFNCKIVPRAQHIEAALQMVEGRLGDVTQKGDKRE
jgi:hypothetical protein